VKPLLTLPLEDDPGAPDRKRAFNEHLFTVVAGEYDFITKALSLGRDAAWKRQLVAGLPALSQPVCVDLACGTGDITRLLARRYPEGSVVGLDLTEPMLALARERTAESNVRYAQADMCATQLPAGTVDIVTGGYALRNAPRLETALAEIQRLLRPGGVATFLDFSKPPAGRAQRLELSVLKAWGGFWGCLLHASPRVYTYIAESLRRHPDRRELHAVIERSGFRIVGSACFFAGIIEIVTFRKPAGQETHHAPG
jgi:demethylmenaquinone methyltransferase/2-methoxy-6-polyprenyl-1,4-benzoquinol methylase